MRRYVVLLAAVAALDNATGQTPAADSARPTALAGTVRDLLGHPVAGVTLTAEGRERSVQTDDSGRFHMAGIPAGPKLFTLAKLGFVAVSFQVRLAPDTTIVIDVHLRPVQSLSEVTVSSPGVSAKLTRDGFYDRKARGWGQYVTPEEIEKRTVSTPAQLIRDMRGVNVRCGGRERRRTGGCVVSSSTSDCLGLFVDGVFARDQIDERLTVGEVYAIEVYSRSSQTPAEFSSPAGRCGAIVVWTKSRMP
jgi:hypothetical protein